MNFKKNKVGDYLLIDSSDGAIEYRGTKEQIKELVWKSFISKKDLSWLTLISVSQWKKQWKSTWDEDSMDGTDSFKEFGINENNIYNSIKGIKKKYVN